MPSSVLTVSRRDLLSVIGAVSGSAAMYHAMTSLGFASDSGYNGQSHDADASKLDPPGIVLFAAAMFGLTWALINGQARGWSSATAIAGFVVGVAAFAAFVAA